tara:strand:- start:1534 stop:1704 length:171 start_codon:yes stop_codon:yes gene_type:complete
MRRIIEFFTKDNNKLEENIEKYEQEEKTKQQESKVLGQKPVKQTRRKEESARMYNS